MAFDSHLPDFNDADGIRVSELEGEFAELNGWNADTEASFSNIISDNLLFPMITVWITVKLSKALTKNMVFILDYIDTSIKSNPLKQKQFKVKEEAFEFIKSNIIRGFTLIFEPN